jgi:hypothetical protein
MTAWRRSLIAWVGADAPPSQQVRQLPLFVGIGDSRRSDISEHVDDLLAGGFGK